jgi:chemotaxis response regulator CheB
MKVGIVNDSKIAAEVLRRIVSNADGFELLWTAPSGEEALRLAAEQRPDIVLMDLIMPGIDGAETTRRLMQASPCVVLVVTATTIGNRHLVFEAMGYGALDAVNTPTLGTQGDMAGAQPLLQKLRMVARLAAPARSRPGHVPLIDALHLDRVRDQVAALAHPHPHGGAASSGMPIVAIGASTGGPQALAAVLSHLPAGFPAAVLVAQHVDEQFAPGLANWLSSHTALPVRLARHGDVVAPGTVWLAATNDHLVVAQHLGRPLSLEYTEHPRETPYRPSVDALFRSVAHLHRVFRMGVLLTGMGRDGAEGLLALRRGGGLTIAQDAASSIVYGMPKAAAELEAAMEILPLKSIGPRIAGCVLKQQPGGPASTMAAKA